MTTRISIALSRLRPTQMTVGMRQVERKRTKLDALKNRPSELVDFILVHPIRVVLGPGVTAYVIDHHHLALALVKEKFETAPMEVEADYSALSNAAFWKKMQAMRFVRPIDANGKRRPISSIPKNLKALADDPYRSLAGFVREAGGFLKVQTPYAEFLWADYYRARIKAKLLKKNFKKAIKEALAIAHAREAAKLPGYVARDVVKKSDAKKSEVRNAAPKEPKKTKHSRPAPGS